MRDLKVIIVDDDSSNRNRIMRCMPDYVEGVQSTYAEAGNVIKEDNAGNVPDMVILNGNDVSGKSLKVFEQMKLSEDRKIARIPVIVITEDEFSDRSFDFLDIADVNFYEGEIDEDRLYSEMMQVIEAKEFETEEPEPRIIEQKSYDKVIGLTIKPDGEDSENKRAVVLDMDDKLENLEQALERGRKKTETIRELLGNAVEYKENKKSSFLSKVRAEHCQNDATYDEHVTLNEEVDEDDIPEEFRLKKKRQAEDITLRVKDIGRKLIENPYMAAATHSRMQNAEPVKTAMTQSAVQTKPQLKPQQRKLIVVVDDEQNERSRCELFLSQKYDVVVLDSGMKAIDYFIRNTADLLLMDTYMPNLGGAQALASVRWQPNGKAVPVIFMIDKRYPVSIESLQGAYVYGMINKPLTAGGLVAAVDSFFVREARENQNRGNRG